MGIQFSLIRVTDSSSLVRKEKILAWLLKAVNCPMALSRKLKIKNIFQLKSAGSVRNWQVPEPVPCQKCCRSPETIQYTSSPLISTVYCPQAGHRNQERVQRVPHGSVGYHVSYAEISGSSGKKIWSLIISWVKFHRLHRKDLNLRKYLNFMIVLTQKMFHCLDSSQLRIYSLLCLRWWSLGNSSKWNAFILFVCFVLSQKLIIKIKGV